MPFEASHRSFIKRKSFHRQHKPTPQVPSLLQQSTMANKTFTSFFLLLVIGSSLAKTTKTMTAYPDVFGKARMDELARGMYRNLVETTAKSHRKLAATNDPSITGAESMCEYVEQAMSGDFLDMQDAGSSCECTGDITDTIQVKCSASDICGPNEEICGSMDFAVILSNVMNEDGTMGTSPSIEMKVCVDVDTIAWMEEICMSLLYEGFELFAPQSCGFTYDGQDCTCAIETMDLEALLGEEFADLPSQFRDVELPCVVWDCSQVVPEPLVDYMQANSCEAVTSDGMDIDGDDAQSMVGFSLLEEEIPPEVKQEMDQWYAENGGGSSATVSFPANSVPLHAMAVVGFAFAMAVLG